MAWAAVAGAVAGPVIGGLMGGGSDGQQQTQTQSKEPWAAAAPWLQANIGKGQALQSQYETQPFNAQQTLGYNKQYGNADYMRGLTGSVLGQLNGFQPFDRSNPYAKPQTFQFPNPQQITAQPTYAQAPMPAQIAPQAAVAAPAPVAGGSDAAYQKWLQDVSGISGVNTSYDSYNNMMSEARRTGMFGDGSGGSPSGGGY